MVLGGRLSVPPETLVGLRRRLDTLPERHPNLSSDLIVCSEITRDFIELERFSTGLNREGIPIGVDF